MTRKEVLAILIRKARANGFPFRRWYERELGQAWVSFDAAVDLLSEEKRYYALLFSHSFARNFWKAGQQIAFVVPASQYTRLNGKGKVITVERKAFTRRTLKPDVWLYHIREMAAAEEPLRYIRRFLVTAEEIKAANRKPPGKKQAGMPLNDFGGFRKPD